MSKPSIDDLMHKMQTPAGGILTWAFNLACEADDILRKEYPRISEYPNGKEFGNFLQIGNIVATLLRIERYLGPADYTPLHNSIMQAFAPSVRHMYIPLLKNLSCFLLQIDETSLSNDELPSFNELLNISDNNLAVTIGGWLVLKMKNAKPTDEFDLQLVSVTGNIVYATNAKMIASIMMADKNSGLLNRTV